MHQQQQQQPEEIVVLNLSELPYSGEAVMNRKKQQFLHSYNEIAKKRVNKTLEGRAVRPLAARDEDSREWTSRETFFRRIVEPLNQRASRNLLRPNGLLETHDSVDNDDPESFHRAIGTILAVAQCFGLLPVAGVRSASPSKLVYRKCSFRTLYALVIFVMILATALISMAHMIQTLKPDTFGVSGGIADATAGAIFYGNGVLGSALFLWLAPRWVSLQRDWRCMERFLDRNKYRPPKLRWKFSIVTALVLSLALVEHLLSIANNIPDNYWASDANVTFRDFLQTYCEKSHGFIFSMYQYNMAMGIYIFISSKLGTFTWNFTDLFVMLVSTGLAERYKSLNRRLAGTIPTHRRNIDWREMRESYAILSSLVKTVDNNISPIVLLSFANNLYFICLQLLNGLSPGESSILSSIYFFGSFAFLIGRTIGVTLLAARISDQSRLALPVLYNCPGPDYNVETQRLLHQMTTDDVSLTGLRFFSITRNFMLAVAGAIVTYEVVLLQFNVAMNK